MHELTDDIHRYLTTGTSSNFLGQEVTILAQWEGADNLLWRVESGGQEAVLKYYLDAGQARGRRQYDGQDQFYRLGIAPQPLWFDRYPTGLSRQVLVYRWASGEELKNTDEAQLMQLAQAVATVHSGDPTEVRRFSPNPINLDYLWSVLHGGLSPLQQWLQQQKADELAALLSALATNAQAVVEAALPHWQGISPTPVHGDLRLENAIGNAGTVHLVDWELFGLGDAAHDVAAFLIRSRLLFAEEVRASWLEHYLATFIQPGLAKRIAVYERILPLHHLLFLLHGLRPSGMEDQRSAEDVSLLRANQHFLCATMLAAIEQSTTALHIESAVDEAELTKLF